jgi:hypothetical protein
MLHVLGALIFTYFVSRGLRALGLRPPSTAKLVLAHVVSFALLTLLVVLLREPLDILYASQILTYAGAQLVWLLFDLYRAQVAFWKPPVAAATESSPTRRAGGSR